MDIPRSATIQKSNQTEDWIKNISMVKNKNNEVFVEQELRSI